MRGIRTRRLYSYARQEHDKSSGTNKLAFPLLTVRLMRDEEREGLDEGQRECYFSEGQRVNLLDKRRGECRFSEQ